MTYVDCPRCGAEMHFRIFLDSDGDADVPGGTRSWLDAECDEKACTCDLDPDEWNALERIALADEYWADE